MSTPEQRAQARKLYKKLLRRIPEAEDIAFLNITAMMDMMTIILVFFLKNFAVTTANVTVSQDLLLPGSTTKVDAHTAVPITITSNAIMVEDEAIATIKGGHVDAAVKRDGENGYFINPLYDTLDKHKRRLKKIEEIGGAPFNGEITVLCDKRIPYRLLSEVLYTAGQAEFNRHRLLVLKREGG